MGSDKPVFCWDVLDVEWVKWEAPQALAPGQHIGGSSQGPPPFQYISRRVMLDMRL